MVRSSQQGLWVWKQLNICASGQVGILGEVSWIQLPEAHLGNYLSGVSLCGLSGGRMCRVAYQVLPSSIFLLGGREDWIKDSSLTRFSNSYGVI